MPGGLRVLERTCRVVVDHAGCHHQVRGHKFGVVLIQRSELSSGHAVQHFWLDICINVGKDRFRLRSGPFSTLKAGPVWAGSAVWRSTWTIALSRGTPRIVRTPGLKRPVASFLRAAFRALRFTVAVWAVPIAPPGLVPSRPARPVILTHLAPKEMLCNAKRPPSRVASSQ